MLSDLEAMGYHIRKEDSLTLIYKPFLVGAMGHCQDQRPYG